MAEMVEFYGGVGRVTRPSRWTAVHATLRRMHTSLGRAGNDPRHSIVVRFLALWFAGRIIYPAANFAFDRAYRENERRLSR